jgi:small subunit ribosomal protein S17
MADQENNETTEAEEAATVSEPEAAAEEAAPSETAYEAAEEAAVGEEPAAEEPVAEPAADAPADEPAADAAVEDAATGPASPPEGIAPAAPAAPSAPQAPPASPKERKAATRARRGKRRPSTPEDRDELRRQKAAARTRRRAAEKAKRAEAGKREGTPPAEHGPGSAKIRSGRVVSDKADKTITVRIDVARRHRRYQKIVRSSTTLHAHDERNDAHEGDLVRVIESRPTSRTKRWRLVEVLERAK